MIKELWAKYWGIPVIIVLLGVAVGGCRYAGTFEVDRAKYDHLATIQDEESKAEVALAMQDGEMSINEYSEIINNLNARIEARALARAREGLKR